MRRPVAVSALIVLTACGGGQEACDLGTSTWVSAPEAPDPRRLAVATAGSGPGKIAFVNSNPLPGVATTGCGPTVGGCGERLKIVFNLRPEVDLHAQRLRVHLFAESQARLECSSTRFDLAAGQTFSIEVACPTSAGDATTPFRTAAMIAETGTGPNRFAQEWNVPFVFLP